MAYLPSNVDINIVLKWAQVHMTSAEILNIVGNPKMLIPGGGPNVVHKLISCIAHYNFGTTAYINAICDVRYVASTTLGSTGILNGLASDTKDLGFATNATTPPNTDIVFYKSSTNPSLGDGSIDFYLVYQEATLA